MQDPHAATAPDDGVPADHSVANSAPQFPDGGTTDHVHMAPVPDAMSTTVPSATPPALLVRGVALSLLVIPLGAAAWLILWNMGFIASIVSFGIAAGAVALYRGGSKHPVNRTAFWALIIVILVAVVVSFFVGVAADIAKFLEMDAGTAVVSGEFWDTYWINIFDNPDMWDSYGNDILMSLLFTGLGCFTVLRRAARESRS